MVMDGVYSVKRYFLGNFYDAEKQDMIDISVGRLKPKKDKLKRPIVNILFIILLLVPIVLFSFWPFHSLCLMQLNFIWENLLNHFYTLQELVDSL